MKKNQTTVRNNVLFFPVDARSGSRQAVHKAEASDFRIATLQAG